MQTGAPRPVTHRQPAPDRHAGTAPPDRPHNLPAKPGFGACPRPVLRSASTAVAAGRTKKRPSRIYMAPRQLDAYVAVHCLAAGRKSHTKQEEGRGEPWHAKEQSSTSMGLQRRWPAVSPGERVSHHTRDTSHVPVLQPRTNHGTKTKAPHGWRCKAAGSMPSSVQQRLGQAAAGSMPAAGASAGSVCRHTQVGSATGPAPPVAIASGSLSFQCFATFSAKGSSGLGALSSAWILQIRWGRAPQALTMSGPPKARSPLHLGMHGTPPPPQPPWLRRNGVSSVPQHIHLCAARADTAPQTQCCMGMDATVALPVQ